jgi:biotin synthesis protein BioG
MQSSWLINQGHPRLILFFNGWGMDAEPFSHLQSEDCDVAVLYDYRDLTLPYALLPRLADYRELYLIAWSLGVWAANAVKDELPRTPVYSLACNGTLNPVHPRFGIHPGIFQSTLENWSETTRTQFYRNMFALPSEAARFSQVQPKRSCADQAHELRSLQIRLNLDPDKVSAGRFDSALISENDMIFPQRAQLRFWEGQSNYRLVPGGHFPFFQWSRWEEMLHAVPATLG